MTRDASDGQIKRRKKEKTSEKRVMRKYPKIWEIRD